MYLDRIEVQKLVEQQLARTLCQDPLSPFLMWFGWSDSIDEDCLLVPTQSQHSVGKKKVFVIFIHFVKYVCSSFDPWQG